MAGWIRVWALALLAVAFWFLARAAYDRPEPLPAMAPATEFSAMRADATLARILGPARPHPAGTSENAAERRRIQNELDRMGVKETTYSTFACNPVHRFPVVTCGTVTDILAEVARGPAEGKVVLLLAHYDSVPAGPGAADDASGDATILETIRALRARMAAGATSDHPVVALFTDGEEYGLLGAAGFLAEPSYRDMVGAAINVEARGSTGPSFLFQTSPGDARLINLYAKNAKQYATSSVYEEIYKFLPNDTDLTLFIDNGLTGYNFAFVGKVADYHTPLDTLKNLSLVTLQQHGDNMLGMAAALKHTDFASLKGGNAVYADFLGLILPRMPAGWALPLSIIVFLMIAASAWRARGEPMNWRERLSAISMPLALLILTALAGLALYYIARLINGSPDPSYARPLALRIALALGVWGTVLLIAPMAKRPVTWLWFAALSIIVSIFLTGFAPYFLFPAIVAAVLLLATARSPRLRPWALLIAAIPALILWIGFVAQGEILMGLAVPPLFTVPAAFGLLALMPLMPELSRREWRASLAVSFGGAIVAAVIAGFQPAYSETWPLRLNVNYVEDHIRNRALWAADAHAPLPLSLRAAAKFESKPEKPYPGAFAEAYLAPAGPMRFDPPTANVTRGKNNVTLSLHGSPDTAQMYLIVPKGAGLTAFTINGKHFAAPPEWAKGDQVLIGCMTPDCRNATLTLNLSTRKPVTLMLAERRAGLPPFGKFLSRARPKTAVPSQLGDGTFVISKVNLNVHSANDSRVEIHILSNGRVTFDNGPQLDLDQFRAKLKEMTGENGCPATRLTFDKVARYDTVAEVMSVLQRAHCQIGFVISPH